MAVLSPQEIFFTAFEPKVANRFYMLIDGIPSYIVKKASAPSFDAGEVVLDHINIYRVLKGKVRWSDMNLELYDPITPAGSQAVMEWMRLSHESVTGRDGYSDFYKKDLLFQILGPPGDVVGEWKIKGAYIKNASFGEYDWASDVAVNINMTVKFDYAILNF